MKKFILTLLMLLSLSNTVKAAYETFTLNFQEQTLRSSTHYEKVAVSSLGAHFFEQKKGECIQFKSWSESCPGYLRAEFNNHITGDEENVVALSLSQFQTSHPIRIAIHTEKITAVPLKDEIIIQGVKMAQHETVLGYSTYVLAPHDKPVDLILPFKLDKLQPKEQKITLEIRPYRPNDNITFSVEKTEIGFRKPQRLTETFKTYIDTVLPSRHADIYQKLYNLGLFLSKRFKHDVSNQLPEALPLYQLPFRKADALVLEIVNLKQSDINEAFMNLLPMQTKPEAEKLYSVLIQAAFVNHRSSITLLELSALRPSVYHWSVNFPVLYESFKKMLSENKLQSLFE